MIFEFNGIDKDSIEKGQLMSLYLAEVLYILEQEYSFEISILKIDFDMFRFVRSITQFVSDSLGTPSSISGEPLVAAISA